MVLSGLVGVAGVAGGVFALTHAATAGQVLNQVLSVSMSSNALMTSAIIAVALGALTMVGVGIGAGKMDFSAGSKRTEVSANQLEEVRVSRITKQSARPCSFSRRCSSSSFSSSRLVRPCSFMVDALHKQD